MNTNIDFKKIAKDIIALQDADLNLRNELINKAQLSNGYHTAMEELHKKNANHLEAIIDKIGYPTIDKVGKEANGASWLVIQHSIGKPKFMKRCAILLEEAVNENKADTKQLAYLTDRIAVFEGRPQLYGTNFDWDENGELSPYMVDDMEKVNQRRKAIGLNTLEEQTKIIKQQAATENEKPPTNYLDRQKQYNEWRKRVGWIN